MKSIAEVVEQMVINLCVKCGCETQEQRESVMYECERCMNTHAE
jgi:reverse gyrase